MIMSDVSALKFGAYCDNNKNRKQLEAYNQAWEDFDAQNYFQGVENILFYLKDENEGNLQIISNENGSLSFEMYQGSAKLTGSFDGNRFYASAVITKLEKASSIVMRKLLDRNQGLLFSRIALKTDKTLSAIMSYTVQMLKPDVIYYGLRELLLLADELDDFLILNFGNAVSEADSSLKLQIPEQEIDLKYKYAQKWITETLQYLNTFNRPDLANYNVYILLTLVTRISYLCAPKSFLEEKLIEISSSYWINSQDGTQPQSTLMSQMIQKIHEIQNIPEQEFKACLYRTRDSFHKGNVMNFKSIKESLDWGIDMIKYLQNNNFHSHALYLTEYTFGCLLFDYNTLNIINKIYHLEMMLIHEDFFQELDIISPELIDNNGVFKKDFVESYIKEVVDKHKELSPDPIVFDYSSIDYTNKLTFCMSLCTSTSKMLSIYE